MLQSNESNVKRHDLLAFLYLTIRMAVYVSINQRHKTMFEQQILLFKSACTYAIIVSCCQTAFTFLCWDGKQGLVKLSGPVTRLLYSKC